MVQAASSLRNWHSSIGKRALKFYSQKFSQEPFKDSPENIKANIKESLSDLVVNRKRMGLKFIYLEPESGGGAYRSDVLVDIFAVHLQIVMKTDPEITYGDPSGALSLCCASAEHGLMAWKDGKLPDASKEGIKSFVENPWATHAAGYLPAIKTLSSGKWKKLCELASEVIKVPDVVDIIDLTAGDASKDNPRSNVLLSDDSDAGAD